MLVNPTAPPFDQPELRRAMTLSLDRKAFNEIGTAISAWIGQQHALGIYHSLAAKG
jgi:hypothetical protein